MILIAQLLTDSIEQFSCTENRGWIICEGSSDKRYIEHWLGQRNNINVISVEVKYRNTDNGKPI